MSNLPGLKEFVRAGSAAWRTDPPQPGRCSPRTKAPWQPAARLCQWVGLCLWANLSLWGCADEPPPPPPAAPPPAPVAAPVSKPAAPPVARSSMNDLLTYLPGTLTSAVGAHVPALQGPPDSLGAALLKQLDPVMRVLARANMTPSHVDYVWAGANEKDGHLLLCFRMKAPFVPADINTSLRAGPLLEKVGKTEVFPLAARGGPKNAIACPDTRTLLIGREATVKAALESAGATPPCFNLKPLKAPRVAYWIAGQDLALERRLSGVSLVLARSDEVSRGLTKPLGFSLVVTADGSTQLTRAGASMISTRLVANRRSGPADLPLTTEPVISLADAAALYAQNAGDPAAGGTAPPPPPPLDQTPGAPAGAPATAPPPLDQTPGPSTPPSSSTTGTAGGSNDVGVTLALNLDYADESRAKGMLRQLKESLGIADQILVAISGSAPAAPAGQASPPSSSAPPGSSGMLQALQMLIKNLSVVNDGAQVQVSLSLAPEASSLVLSILNDSARAAGATPLPDGIYDGTFTSLETAVQQVQAKPDARGATLIDELPLRAGYGWMIDLLPHLGHSELYEQFDRSRSWTDDRNRQLTGTVITEFLNPMDGRRRWAGYPFGGMALTHFVGMSGVEDRRNVVAASLPRSDPRAGIFGYDSIAKPAEITDGTSQTIMLVGSGQTMMAPWVQGGGATIRGARAPYFDKLSGLGSVGAPGGGTFVLFADGSARVIPPDIDPAVFKAMCTMHGAEKIDLKQIDEKSVTQTP